MIITWKIEKLTRDLSDGFINYALLSVTASKGGLSSMMNATCFFEKPNDLVPYEGLSEAKVMSWCLERINLESIINPSTMNVQECEDTVKAELQEKLVPTQKDGFPWEGT
tara:strand:+ start:1551 stop:1880 length:330 start_codon:yes stop_codon:yes gene_type:complete